MSAIQNRLLRASNKWQALRLAETVDPTLNPIQHDFDTPTSRKSLWNQRLATIFAEHLALQNPLYQGASNRIIEHFLSRIQSLRAIIEHNIPKNEDTDLTVFSENTAADQRRTLRLKRIRARLTSVRSL